MDTKWKNITKKMSEFWRVNRQFIFGALVAALGFALVGYIFYNSRFYMSTADTW